MRPMGSGPDLKPFLNSRHKNRSENLPDYNFPLVYIYLGVRTEGFAVLHNWGILL